MGKKDRLPQHSTAVLMAIGAVRRAVSEAQVVSAVNVTSPFRVRVVFRYESAEAPDGMDDSLPRAIERLIHAEQDKDTAIVSTDSVNRAVFEGEHSGGALCYERAPPPDTVTELTTLQLGDTVMATPHPVLETAGAMVRVMVDKVVHRAPKKELEVWLTWDGDGAPVREQAAGGGGGGGSSSQAPGPGKAAVAATASSVFDALQDVVAALDAGDRRGAEARLTTLKNASYAAGFKAGRQVGPPPTIYY